LNALSLIRWLGAATLVLFVGCSSNGDSPVDPDQSQLGVSPPPRAEVEAPVPFDAVMNDMWASPTGSVFAVGNEGNIAMFRGGSWTRLESGVLHKLSAVWGTSDSNVFAVGGGGCIIRFDGNSWSPVASGFASELRDIAGTPGGTIYAMSPEVLLRSSDGGNTWTRTNFPFVSTERYTCIEADATHGVYVGTSESLYQLAGNTMTRVADNFNVEDIWIAESGDVFFIEPGGLQRFTGSNVLLIALSNDLSAIDGTDLDNVYVVGGSFNEALAFELTAAGLIDIGTGLPLERNVTQCAVMTDGTLLVSGFRTTSASFAGGAWTAIDRDDAFSYRDIFGVGDEIFAVSSPRDGSTTRGFLHRFSGDQWLSPLPVDARLNAVWARATNDVFAVGDGVFHFDGASVTEVNTGLTASSSFQTVFGNDDVVFVGGGESLWKFDGTWSDVSDLLLDRVDRLAISALWVAPSGEAFVGLGQGLAVIDGSEVRIINAIDIPFLDIDDMFGFDANNIYMVDTSNYQILHWNGSRLTVELVSEDMDRSVWGPAPNNVMVAGSGLIHHFNGQGWKSVIVGTNGIHRIGGSNTATYALGLNGGRARIVQ
jgi:hypothetical protein